MFQVGVMLNVHQRVETAPCWIEIDCVRKSKIYTAQVPTKIQRYDC